MYCIYDLLQSAVGYDYEGKTEKHASQKGKNSNLKINDHALKFLSLSLD